MYMLLIALLHVTQPTACDKIEGDGWAELHVVMLSVTYTLLPPNGSVQWT